MSFNEIKQENAYYLKNRKEGSNVFTEDIRELFEERMKGIYGFSINLERLQRSGYIDDFYQSKWEEFFNGFRLGEDSVSSNEELKKDFKWLIDTYTQVFGTGMTIGEFHKKCEDLREKHGLPKLESIPL